MLYQIDGKKTCGFTSFKWKQSFPMSIPKEDFGNEDGWNEDGWNEDGWNENERSRMRKNRLK